MMFTYDGQNIFGPYNDIRELYFDLFSLIYTEQKYCKFRVGFYLSPIVDNVFEVVQVG